MKNSPNLNTQLNDSPKTPGGISKALLTPCRRVGLSRSWKKKGPIPFISPLASENNKVCPAVKDHPKCKTTPGTPAIIPETSSSFQEIPETNGIVSTPKSVAIPRRSKSKKSLSKEKLIEAIAENDAKQTGETTISFVAGNQDKDPVNATESFSTQAITKVESVLLKSPCATKPYISINKSTKATPDVVARPTKSKSIIKNKTSPENLTKECIIVIQRKLLPKEKHINPNIKENVDLNKRDIKVSDDHIEAQTSGKVSSQVLFDSDSDDVPLQNIKKKDNPVSDCKKRPRPQPFHDDEDFVDENKVSKLKKIEHKNTSTSDSIIKKLEDKSTSITELKVDKKKTDKLINHSKISSRNLNNSIDDLDDFDLDCKKTILIKKTYDKVTKLSKAKSTGSITQKDIDDLKARIEIKKNLLLAKIKTEDTEELRNLIKKWRKGCQDALMELMDLMKTKFPDRQNMDYSEILQTLRIPPDLVGYDSDTDCFESPDEATMILSKM